MKWTLKLVGHSEIVGECESYDDAMKQADEHCDVGVWAFLGRYADKDVDYTEYMRFLYDYTKEKKPYGNEYIGSLVIYNDEVTNMTLLDYELPTNQNPNPFILELPRDAKHLSISVKEYQAVDANESGISFGSYTAHDVCATFLVNNDSQVCSYKVWCYEPNDDVDIESNAHFMGVANVSGHLYHYWIGVCK